MLVPCSLEGGDWREKLCAGSVSLQENWHHQRSSCLHQRKYGKYSCSQMGEMNCDPPQKGGVELSQTGVISHRLSGTGMGDSFSCFKLEVSVIRSRFLPQWIWLSGKRGLTVKVGRLCFCWSCNVISVMQNIPWWTLELQDQGQLLVVVSSDWLPEHVNWKELGSSPNLLFSEAYAMFRLLKARCMAESPVCSYN